MTYNCKILIGKTSFQLCNNRIINEKEQKIKNEFEQLPATPQQKQCL
jgi:hypothetical protein